MFDTTTGQSQQVAQHDAPVKVVRWVDAQGGILATGSWDKTLKVMSSYFSFILPPCQPHVETHTNIQYWDLRQSTPVVSVQLPERCYTMDVQFPLMVVGTAERHIQIFNLTNPVTPYKVSFAGTTKFIPRTLLNFWSSFLYIQKLVDSIAVEVANPRRHVFRS